MSRDKLEEMFDLQSDFNRRVGYDTKSMRERFDPLVAGKWLNDYIIASDSELDELRNCTFWKHWCSESKSGRRFEINDLQNARVEVIDLFFFWMSLAQCVGLDASDVYELYLKKLGVNHARQDAGYSMAEKDECDNKEILLQS